MTDQPPAQITMSRIPVRGGVGAFAVIVILVLSMLAALPQLRWRFLGGVALGLVFAAALILWRRRTMDAHTLPPGAHTMFAPEPAAAARATLSVDETGNKRPVSRLGAPPRVARAS